MSAPVLAPAPGDATLVEQQLTIPFEDAAARTYDVVLVGGGATAAVLLAGLRARRPGTRVLVLEQGPFLLPDHVQNLGLPYQPLMSEAVASPWRADGDLEVVAQVPYLGGRTLVWSGSSPQPTREQLVGWPAQVVDDLDAHWDDARRLLGVRRAPELGPEYGALHAQLRERVRTAAARIPGVVPVHDDADLDAPLAMAAGRDGTTRKFSAAPLLLEAVVDDEHVDLVTRCHVQELVREGDRVVAVRTSQGTLPVGDAQVVLTLGATEATRLVLDSLPGALAGLAGTNLAANTATWFSCRLPRDRFRGLSTEHAELAALYVDGTTADRQYHLHLTACTTADPRRDVERVFHLMPDMFGAGTPARVSDPDHVVLLVHGLCELAADASAPEPSRVRVGADGSTVGTYRLGAADREAWDAMDRAADALVEQVADGAEVEYWWPGTGTWEPTPPADRRMSFAVHEAGTLFMGEDPTTSVSDLTGRLRALGNVWVTGGATFPTRGSWNPFLTMAALCLRQAGHLAAVVAPGPAAPSTTPGAR